MAAAAALSRRGYSVHLYNRTHERIAAILEQGGVAIEGDLVGGDQAEELVPLALITTDVAAAMENIDLILIAVPAYGQKAMLEACLPCLRSGQIILLLTGSAAPQSPKALRPAVFNTRSVPAGEVARNSRAVASSASGARSFTLLLRVQWLAHRHIIKGPTVAAAKGWRRHTASGKEKSDISIS